MPEAYREGVALKREKDFDGAMERFERMFTQAGINLTCGVEARDLAEENGRAAVFALAQWASSAGYHSRRVAESIAALRLLLSLAPHRRGAKATSLRYSLAYALRRQGSLDEALAEYTLMFRMNPESRSLQSAIAAMLCDLGRYEEALEWIDAYRGSFNGQEIAFRRGLTLFHLCRQDEALRELRRLIGEENQYWVRQARETIAKIESGSLRPARSCSAIRIEGHAAPK